MSRITTLTTNQQQYNLNAVKCFKKLKVSAHVSNLAKTDSLPVLELKLQNETESFNLFLRQVPNSLNYATLDILAIARQLPSLQHTPFNKLQVTNTQPETLNENQVITLQFNVAE